MVSSDRAACPDQPDRRVKEVREESEVLPVPLVPLENQVLPEEEECLDPTDPSVPRARAATGACPDLWGPRASRAMSVGLVFPACRV